MDLGVWIAYLVATFVLSLSPGPGAFSSMSSGLHHGFRLGVWNGVGMQAANVCRSAWARSSSPRRRSSRW
jgi:homoserine/homoserine lactone efflux protein